jgi:hypothetical protein
MRLKLLCAVSATLAICFSAPPVITAQQATSSSAREVKPQSVPAVDEWSDAFEGKSLDTEKWERFTFEGGGGGKVEVVDGQLRMRGMNRSRAGLRSRRSFNSDRFIFEATLVKVGAPLPLPNERITPPGNAILALMFDGSGRNRIEWLLTSEGVFEAWAVIDGRGERLDNRSLGTKARNPTLAIVRRGDEFLFMLNGQAGLQKTMKNMPRAFHVMLYGFGSSENNWDSVRVVTAK